MFANLEQFLMGISVQAIYQNIWNIFGWIYYSLTGICMLFFGGVRLLEDGLGGITGEIEWGKLIRTFIIITACISMLFPFFHFIISVKDGFISIFDFNMQNELSRSIAEKLKCVAKNSSDKPMWKLLIGKVQEYFFYSSYQIIKALSFFLDIGVKIALAIVWSVAILLSPIAISSSLTNKFSFLRGWAMLLAGVIMWEFLMALFSLFINLTFDSLEYDKLGVKFGPEDMYLLLSLRMCLDMAASVAALLVAFRLVANQVSGIGLASPFMAASAVLGYSFSRSMGTKSNSNNKQSKQSKENKKPSKDSRKQPKSNPQQSKTQSSHSSHSSSTPKQKSESNKNKSNPETVDKKQSNSANQAKISHVPQPKTKQ